MVERGVRQCAADRISERECRHAVHNGVLSHEPRTRTVEHDQLYRFVYPAIAETIRGTVPKEARGCQKVARRRRIQAEHECGRVNRVEQRGVRRRKGAQVYVIRCPQVSVCDSQRTNGGQFGGRCGDDMFDLATDGV